MSPVARAVLLIRSAVGILRGGLPPDTAEARSRDRLRRIVLSIGASGASRLVTIAAMVITVPMTLQYLGQERYGIWAVISSFSVMLAFADMGLGNGVLNAVARAHGKGDRSAIRATISSGYALLICLAVILVSGFFIVFPHIDWPKLFNVRSSQARAEAGPAIAAFVVMFACAIPVTLIQKIQFGLQQGFVNSVWQCAGSALTLIFLTVVVLLNASLPWLVIALLIGPLLASVLNTFVFFGRRGASLRPSLTLVQGRVVRSTLGAGLIFFLLQLLASLAFGSDPVIIAQTLGAAAVASYAVPDRLFSIIPMVLNMILAPLWPAYGEAAARGDHRWVKTALTRTVAATLCGASVLSLLFVLAGRPLLHLWVGPQINATVMLLVAMGTWKVVEAVNTTLAIYMNGTGMLKVQTVIASVSCTVMVLAKIVLVKAIGLAGIPIAAVLVALPLSTLPLMIVILRRLEVLDAIRS